jgi:hypothetical protein
MVCEAVLFLCTYQPAVFRILSLEGRSALNHTYQPSTELYKRWPIRSALHIAVSYHVCLRGLMGSTGVLRTARHVTHFVRLRCARSFSEL